MERIKSFQINHNILEPGFYISREDDGVITYDLRTRKPNAGDYMDNATMHSVEHMFATYARNSEESENIIYFGPMGCRTGFYVIFKGDLDSTNIVELMKEMFKFIAEYEGEVPGADPRSCGNYLDQNLPMAKYEANLFVKILKENPCFDYPQSKRINTEKGLTFFDS